MSAADGSRRSAPIRSGPVNLAGAQGTELTFGFLQGRSDYEIDPLDRLGYVELGFKPISGDRTTWRSAGIRGASCPISCPSRPGQATAPGSLGLPNLPLDSVLEVGRRTEGSQLRFVFAHDQSGDRRVESIFGPGGPLEKVSRLLGKVLK